MRTRITIGMIIIFVVSAGLFCGIMSYTTWNTQRSEAKRYSVSELNALVWKLNSENYPMDIKDSPYIKDTILRYRIQQYASLSREDMDYVLQKGEEDIFNNSSINASYILDSMKTDEIEMGNEKYRAAFFKYGSRYYSVAGGTIMYDGEEYDISVVRDVTESMNRVRMVAVWCIFINLGIVIVSIVISILFLKHSFAPLEQLKESTRAIAQGDYGQRIGSVRKDEVGELADSFDRMGEAVELHIREVENKVEEQDMLIHALAHEMKTPVTAIAGYAFALQSANISEKQQEEAVSFIDMESRRLERLSSKLTQLIMAEHNRIELQSISVHAFAKQLEGILVPKADRQNVSLHIEVPEDDYNIEGDADLLCVLLTNLYDNAYKAGACRIGIHFAVNEWTVTDNGCGIPEDELTKIMQPFYQGDKSRSDEGFGLGLAICKKIADLHRMELRIMSVVGEGSCVYMTINC
ncbi:MAG: HAMP domain-containing histidine kinase [Lachnospiraceae bacterium]|nr:HAMP domain-containing histidine kinase [Lachnospiraceae bacterium]